jgi:hypothetical protein
MAATSVQNDADGRVRGAAIGYVVDPKLTFQPAPNPWDSRGAGGVYSDVLDLLRWASNFWTGSVGGAAFLHAQLEAGPAEAGIGGLGPGRYAAGVRVLTYRGGTLVWHGGAEQGVFTALFILPSNHRALAIICNSDFVGDPTFDLGLKVLDAWFGS